MDYRHVTVIVIVATAVVWIVWDVFVALKGKRGDTESEVIRDYCIYPVVPAALGTLCGHWTMLDCRLVGGGTWPPVAIVMVTGTWLLAWSVLVRMKWVDGGLTRVHDWIGKRPYLAMIAGYIFGGLVWGLPSS